MKTFRSSFLRPFGSVVHGAWILSMVLGGWYGLLWLITRVPGPRPRRVAWQGQLEDPAFLIPAAIMAVIGIWIVLHKFGANRGRYHAGARELEVRSGLVWQKVVYVRYADIKSVELREGPLMRLFGTSDLEIAAGGMPYRVVLHGVAGGADVRRFLLERRDSLKELASEKAEGAGKSCCCREG